ncbi:Uncharacterized protein TCM_039118 [Theobroma cacao]|uniref:Uncharacterized protein n=1 Tax=Theobroma cacao TaxID=3641 RepID=A0A061GQP1_THECC|nr:Uncharacterized protein TCM_039118 [Theobroma cacao]
MAQFCCTLREEKRAFCCNFWRKKKLKILRKIGAVCCQFVQKNWTALCCQFEGEKVAWCCQIFEEKRAGSAATRGGRK